MGSPWIPARIFLVECDHSIVVVKTTLRAGVTAAKLRHKQASKPIAHFVVGPFVPSLDLKFVEVP